MMENNDILDDMDQVRPKERHGCVTTWLIFMIIGNAAAGVMYLFFWNDLMEMVPEEALENIPDVNPMFIGALSVLNLVFAILLLKWKKIGFWGTVATSIIAMGLNIQAGMDSTQVVMGLFGVLLLYGILQIPKDEASAWSHLE